MKRKWHSRLIEILLCLIFAVEFMVVLDSAMAFAMKPLAMKNIALIFVALSALLSVLVNNGRCKCVILFGTSVLTAMVVVVALFFGCWTLFSNQAKYADVDDGKNKLYAGKQVMVIVPHQDDEINLMGGLLEEYIKYGSELRIVYVTNGDFDFSAEVRYTEAISAMCHLGIPEDNLFFLGFGDQWCKNGPHLYNAEPGKIVESAAGRQKTYGTEGHKAYLEGLEYSGENLLYALESVILEYRPDILFCSDYDTHIDHRAVSLAFEKVMGKILKENKEYRPDVFKGYAYSTAWGSYPDYYDMNIRKTVNPYVEPIAQTPMTYRWEDRVRLPVSASSLSRSLLSGELYNILEKYESQNARENAEKIINGDKVFWHRDTNSLCYSAKLEVSSGNRDLLTDFMLVDDMNIKDADSLPYDGVWIPDADDSEKSIRMDFRDKVFVDTICLYDHPSENKNVLNMSILFDDGTVIETGALDPHGRSTRLLVKKRDVEWLEMRIADQEGADAGISEVEIFALPADNNLRFIKMMDADENFVYDYWFENSDTEKFGLYASENVPAISEENYLIECDNDACLAVWEDDGIRITCPEGESCTVTVSCKDQDLSDSVYIHNPDDMTRWWTHFWQTAEENALPYYHSDWYKKTAVYRIGSRLICK